MDLCLPGSGDLRKSSSQTDQNMAQILLFHDDLLMLYQAFGVNLFFIKDVVCLLLEGPARLIRYASIRTYSVYKVITSGAL